MNKNIAIISFSKFRLGDALIFRNFFKSISEHHNKKIIIFSMHKSPIEEVLKYDDFVLKIIRNDFRKGFKQIRDFIDFKRAIKYERIETIYLFDSNLRPVLFSFLSGIKNILGFGFGLQKFFMTKKNFLPKEYYFLNDFQILSKFLQINDIVLDKSIIKINNLKKNKSKIFLNLDSSDIKKNWSIENYKLLIKKLSKKENTIFYINAPNIDSDIFKYLSREKIEFVDLSKDNLNDLFNKINECNFAICNDTGPAHIAINLGIKTIIIFLKKNKYSYVYSKHMVPIFNFNYQDIGKLINNILEEINSN